MVSRPPSGAIRVLVADADRVLTQGLRRTLSADERIDVVGTAQTGRETVKLAALLLPDVVLMGLGLSDIDAIEATKRIRETVRSAQVLLLAPSERQHDVSRALEAGAAGFVRRHCTSPELLTPIFALAMVAAVDAAPHTLPHQTARPRQVPR
ncbi:MAG TPA: response regulator transcription factor [Gaiellaceae bacterium]|nr:response regulator transcription factor [Gaiellaceae bacterium]